MVPDRCQRLGPLSEMAGFQPSTNGRIWVFTEAFSGSAPGCRRALRNHARRRVGSRASARLCVTPSVCRSSPRPPRSCRRWRSAATPVGLMVRSVAGYLRSWWLKSGRGPLPASAANQKPNVFPNLDAARSDAELDGVRRHVRPDRREQHARTDQPNRRGDSRRVGFGHAASLHPEERHASLMLHGHDQPDTDQRDAGPRAPHRTAPRGFVVGLLFGRESYRRRLCGFQDGRLVSRSGRRRYERRDTDSENENCRSSAARRGRCAGGCRCGGGSPRGWCRRRRRPRRPLAPCLAISPCHASLTSESVQVSRDAVPAGSLQIGRS